MTVQTHTQHTEKSAGDIDTLDMVAQRLDQAAHTASAMTQLSTQGVTLSLDGAYQVQDASVARRFARGEHQLGIKMGFTSRAKMQQMGVNEMIWGPLTSGMQIEEGGTLDLANFIHPRVEPEIAFLLKKDLCGPVSFTEAMDAVEAVAPALEIIDSRYRDFRFSLHDVIADNCSSSGFVVGQWRRDLTQLDNLGMVLEMDGAAVEFGSSAAILGNPWRSLVAAARLASERGRVLKAGWTVLAGAATAARPLTAGNYIRLQCEALGDVEFRVRDSRAAATAA
ncbi:fumarylacetoacetate hydrolase family protein [uncultured Microbulbifer sp.]|uniref:2-keto-4-pentenoate hydratase n=1 Tax=uncultured Microbulbifer sp. TaxID=348147 RepID=UPI00262DD9E6|nr:fumarylacetoacetate hydrolase family protein [uncultured Microbulbifer sp.]